MCEGLCFLKHTMFVDFYGSLGVHAGAYYCKKTAATKKDSQHPEISRSPQTNFYLYKMKQNILVLTNEKFIQTIKHTLAHPDTLRDSDGHLVVANVSEH